MVVLLNIENDEFESTKLHPFGRPPKLNAEMT
jgi:hypothetical protein